MSTPKGPKEQSQENIDNKKQKNIESAINNEIKDFINKCLSERTSRENLQKILQWNDDKLKEFKNKLNPEIEKLFLDESSQKEWKEAHKEAMEDKNIKTRILQQMTARRELEENLINKRNLWFKNPLNTTRKKELQEKLKNFEDNDLKRAFLSAKTLQEFFGKHPDITPYGPQSNDIYDTNELLRDIRDAVTDETWTKFEEDDDFKEAIEVFVNTGDFDEEKLWDLLGADFVSTEKKKEIIEKIFPNISYKIAKENSLVADSTLSVLKDQILEDISMEFYSMSFSSLTDENQQELKTHFDKISDFIEINTSLINATTLDNALKNKQKVQEYFIKIFAKQKEAQDQVLEDWQNEIETFFGLKKYLESYLTVEQKSKLENGNTTIEDMRKGKFIKYTLTNGKKVFWKISDEGGMGKAKNIKLIKYELAQVGGLYTWREADDVSYYSYPEFAKMIGEQLDNNFITTLDITSETDAPETAADLLKINSRDELKKAIDEMDEDGTNKQKWFEEWMIFSVIVSHNEWKESSEMVKVKHIDDTNKKVTLELFDKQILVLSFSDFIESLDQENMQIRRIWTINNEETFAKNASISTIKWWENSLENIHGLVFHENKLQVKDSLKPSEQRANNTTEYTDTFKPLWWFKNNKWAFIKVDFDGEGNIKAHIWKYDKKKDLNEERYSDEALKNLSKKEQEKRKKEWEITEKQHAKVEHLTYTGLLQLLQQYKATEAIGKTSEVKSYNRKTDSFELKETDPLTAYEEEIRFKNGEHMKEAKPSLFSFRTIGEIYYYGKHVWDYYEKKFEHRAEVKSAYAFIRMNKLTGAGGVDAMARLINGTKDDWKNRYKWVDMREFIKNNIILNEKAKPHEILAGLMIVIEMGWHLYPDSHLQEYLSKDYVWFNKICNAIGVDPKASFKKCYEKVANNDDKDRSYAAEEDMITRLFKANQGNPFVQAIGGGAPFWKSAEATKWDQKAKWEKEVKDFVNEKDRAQYAISKMYSNEYEIALGAIPEIFNKGTDMDGMAPFFILAASNATNYVSSSTLDQFHSFRYKWQSFNAIPFCKNVNLSNTYKETIELALRLKHESTWDKKYADALQEYKQIKLFSQRLWSRHDEKIIKDLNSFWSKYHSILQPLLQLTDPILQVAMMKDTISSDEKSTIESYVNTLHGMGKTYAELGGLKQYKDFNGVNGTYGVKSSHVFVWAKWIQYRSLSLQLDTLEIDNVRASMSGASRNTGLYRQIIDYFKMVRDNETFQQNPDYQKEQFKIIYSELIKKLIEKTFPIDKDKFDQGKYSTLKHFGIIESELGIKLTYDYLNQQNTNEWWFDFAKDVDNNPEIFANFLNSGKNRWGNSQFVQWKISGSINKITLEALTQEKSTQDAFKK